MTITTVRYRGLSLEVCHATELRSGTRCTHLESVIALSSLPGIMPGTDITELMTLGEKLSVLHRAVERSN